MSDTSSQTGAGSMSSDQIEQHGEVLDKHFLRLVNEINFEKILEDMDEDFTHDQIRAIKSAKPTEDIKKPNSTLLVQTVRGDVKTLMGSFIQSLNMHHQDLAKLLVKGVDEKVDEQKKKDADPTTAAQLSYDDVLQWAERTGDEKETLRFSADESDLEAMLERLEGLKKGTLKNLYLRNYNIEVGDHAARLGKFFEDNTQLECLRFDNVKFLPTEGMASLELKSLESLRHLSFTGMTVDVEGLKEMLDNNKHLISITLNQCEGTKSLLQNANSCLTSKSMLENLSLNDNCLRDESMGSIVEILKRCEVLKTISLDKNEITDNGVGKLFESRRELRSLSLKSNQISDLGARSIAKALYDRGNFHSLNLADNQIGSSGAKKLLERWNTAPKCIIDLRQNQIKVTDPFPAHFLILDNDIGEKRLGRVFARMDDGEAFFHLNLDSTSLNDKSVEQVVSKIGKDHPTLLSLSLEHNNLTDKTLLYLVRLFHENPKLEKILVGDNKIKDSRYHMLDRSEQEVGVLGMREDFGKLIQGSNGTAFQMKSVQLQLVDTFLLSEFWKIKFASVSIIDCDISDEAIDGIIHCFVKQEGALKDLVISGNKMTKNGSKRFVHEFKGHIGEKKFKNLVSLDIHNNDWLGNLVESISSELMKNEIQHLDISENNTGFLTCLSLHNPLKKNKSLRCLNFRKGDIGDYGILLIGRALADRNHLEELDISSNKITSVPNQIRRMIERSLTLRKLNLSMNELKTTNITKLIKSFEESKSIEELNLKGVNMKQEGVKCLANILPTQTSIKTLNVSLNSFGLEGLIALAEGLFRNRTLEHLDASGNIIRCYSKNDVLRVEKSLWLNKTLKSISLVNCSLNDVTALALTETCSVCESLLTLDMRDNFLTKEGQEKVKNYFKFTRPHEKREESEVVFTP